MKLIDLVQLRREIKDGLLTTFIKRGKIYIQDTENGECVMIGNVDAQMRMGWTPCSSGLPKKSGMYFVTYSHGNFQEMGEAYFDTPCPNWRKPWEVYFYKSVPCDPVTVIAWMPMPPIYKESEEE